MIFAMLSLDLARMDWLLRRGDDFRAARDLDPKHRLAIYHDDAPGFFMPKIYAAGRGKTKAGTPSAYFDQLSKILENNEQLEGWCVVEYVGIPENRARCISCELRVYGALSEDRSDSVNYSWNGIIRRTNERIDITSLNEDDILELRNKLP
jgi:hypothetical protein